jgi:hypothetical protein
MSDDPRPMSDETIHELLARALDAYAELEGLGEDIEDEWTYVTDLEAAWRDRLLEVDEARGEAQASPELVAAVDAAIGEIARIGDPHRAIDWLSTFPQVVLVALGEPS